MRNMAKENPGSNPKKLESLIPRNEFVVVHLLVVLLMGFMSVSQGRFIVTPTMQRGRDVPAMYVLGDSSVDCGDNTLFYPLLHRNLSLYPCNGSDSSLLPHLLAEKMGLPNIPPFYSQNGSIEELLRGINFGSAEATIMNPSSQNYQSLNQQLRQVFETIELLYLQLSQRSVIQFIRSSIFYLSFGKDDYIDLFLRNSSGALLEYSSQEFANILATQMVHVIRNLYNLNARKIICMGILPLGCTPRMLSLVSDSNNSTNGGRKCVEKINKLVLEYNAMLNEQIVELNAELPDAHIVFCDVYQGIREIITYPETYGFEDVNSACCGLGPYGATIGCLSMEMACNEASSHVWWDLYNPTKAVNSLLADSAWFGQPFSGICRPFTIHELAAASVSLPSHNHLN
ncbi:GDSL esterase/lipase At1g71250 [Ziziphus jujuba]|uniref:GDSL esterase/lipase At1g71250 n=2 Tax=Ziziphus jujuba TaxID=326968 RepID=A0A6P3Z7N3_ZIZJJ|nr:GDSL esterase/lipase At1g71250 [Ziziphus jujuba]KAH7541890.1 hypothetical protein FEM48_Zijuj02G0015300 [Ziziphus jujuba var. spinosa]